MLVNEMIIFVVFTLCNAFCLLDIFAILLSITLVFAKGPWIKYSIVGLPSSKESEFGVLIDRGEIYRLIPSKEDPTLLFQVEAPAANSHFCYVEVNKRSGKVVNKEQFRRGLKDLGMLQVFGRSWTTQPAITFDRVYDEIGFRRETDLHPNDEIPIIHIIAPQKEIDRIHDHYNQKIKIKADINFIRQVVRVFFLLQSY